MSPLNTVPELTLRLAEAESAIAAILSGEIDAVAGREGVPPVLLAKAQIALQRSEARYRGIVETTNEGMATVDSDCMITFVNTRLTEMLGFPVEEMTGKSLLDFMPNLAGDCREEFDRIAARTQASQREVVVDLLQNDGSSLAAAFRWSPIRDEGSVQVGGLVMVTDITLRLEAERAREHSDEQLRQAQKMEAVGRLAGGIAHDFNNLLTVIGAHCSFILESLSQDDPNREDIEAIHQAGMRASALTRQLLTFSRKELVSPVTLDLNGVISETLKMVGRLLGEDITIVAELAAKPGRVRVDPSQFDQVLLNLVSNARDAMPSGGTLAFRTRQLSVNNESNGVGSDVPRGNYVVLEVQDTGAGMNAAVKARLFEPFFTTKPTGKGTGLGLATVYGIVKQFDGFITVKSVPQQGTTFEIYLPQAAEEAENGDGEVAGEAPRVGTERVLIIEDDAAVRVIATRVLQREGYDVLEAASGREALELSNAFAGTIDVIVSDSVMPGMSGGEVVATLQSQRPLLRALFISGYTDDELFRRGILASRVHFLQKPFTPIQLATAVRQTLDADRRTFELGQPAQDP